jgi:predicted CoA-binding protein
MRLWILYPPRLLRGRKSNIIRVELKKNYKTMATLKEAVSEFLALKRIAVAGVSRTKKDAANAIYVKLRDSGYEVFAVNPNADEVEGDRCYPDLRSIPQKVEGVVIVTRPQVTEQIVKECAEAGVSSVWMHKAVGNSVSGQAVQFCRESGIKVIAGACPMMYCQPVDFGHKCFRVVLGVLGKLPKKV